MHSNWHRLRKFGVKADNPCWIKLIRFSSKRVFQWKGKDSWKAWPFKLRNTYLLQFKFKFSIYKKNVINLHTLKIFGWFMISSDALEKQRNETGEESKDSSVLKVFSFINCAYKSRFMVDYFINLTPDVHLLCYIQLFSCLVFFCGWISNDIHYIQCTT